MGMTNRRQAGSAEPGRAFCSLGPAQATEEDDDEVVAQSFPVLAVLIVCTNPPPEAGRFGVPGQDLTGWGSFSTYSAVILFFALPLFAPSY